MLKLIRNLEKQDFSIMALILVLISGQVYLELAIPDYMSEITLLVQSEGSVLEEIYSAGAKMLGCALGSLVISVIVAVFAAKIAANFSFILRGKVFERVLGFSMKEVNSFSTASLITRTTNDITQVQLLIVMGLQMLIKAPLMALWAVYKISNSNTTFTIATAIAMAVLITVVSTCMSMAIPRFRLLQTLTDNVNRVAKTQLDGLAVIRAYHAEEYEGKKFEVVNQDITSTNLFVGRIMSFLMPSIQSISSILTLCFYLLGAALIDQAVGMDKMVIFSDMVVFSSYAILIIMSFMMLCMVFMLLPRATVAANRICEVLETPSSLKEGSKEEGLPGKKGEIQFKNVCFRYPDGEEDVLSDISFTAHQGETVALIGSTGCGKTSLLNLVPRFYDATQGEILINGVNVKEYRKSALQGLIGYVSQRAVLFSGTVESNVTLGDNPALTQKDQPLDSSLAIAQAQEFVQSLPEKEEATVAQGGGNFSGGQKQRISIARAVYRDPEIYIFDDSFSALDYKTDRNLRDRLNQECKDSTRLIIGQRIGTIQEADKILVLEHGRIVGMGKHRDLLKTCEVYHQIALSQLSEEELSHG